MRILLGVLLGYIWIQLLQLTHFDGIRPNNNAVAICSTINLLIDGDCTADDAKNTITSRRVQAVTKTFKYVSSLRLPFDFELFNPV